MATLEDPLWKRNADRIASAVEIFRHNKFKEKIVEKLKKVMKDIEPANANPKANCNEFKDKLSQFSQSIKATTTTVTAPPANIITNHHDPYSALSSTDSFFSLSFHSETPAFVQTQLYQKVNAEMKAERTTVAQQVFEQYSVECLNNKGHIGQVGEVENSQFTTFFKKAVGIGAAFGIGFCLWKFCPTFTEGVVNSFSVPRPALM